MQSGPDGHWMPLMVHVQTVIRWKHVGVEPKIMVPPNHPFVHRVFHEIFTIHFGFSPLFLETPMWNLFLFEVGSGRLQWTFSQLNRIALLMCSMLWETPLRSELKWLVKKRTNYDLCDFEITEKVVNFGCCKNHVPLNVYLLYMVFNMTEMACEKIVQRIGCKEDCTKNLSDFHFRALYTYIYIYIGIYIYIRIYVEPFFISRTADRVVFLRGRLVGSNHLDFTVKFAHPQNRWNYFAHICHTLPKKS